MFKHSKLARQFKAFVSTSSSIFFSLTFRCSRRRKKIRDYFKNQTTSGGVDKVPGFLISTNYSVQQSHLKKRTKEHFISCFEKEVIPYGKLNLN